MRLGRGPWWRLRQRDSAPGGCERARCRTLEEIGWDFEVTRERIRQIEAKGLRKLRHPSRSKQLKSFIDN
ncbi:MAG: hypothetical protein JW940_30455 [Polyangiaceae bacterium]|nr:hypothetical protein [Polyangiaceae bacterium]